MAGWQWEEGVAYIALTPRQSVLSALYTFTLLILTTTLPFYRRENRQGEAGNFPKGPKLVSGFDRVGWCS